MIEQKIRWNVPVVGVKPYRQIHAHSTGNPRSTAEGEANYMNNKDINSGFYTHVVGNGRIIQTAPVNQGAWDVGGGWNYEAYAAVELIESHKTYDEFYKDYTLYVNLLRDLADEAGIPKTLDSNVLEGIKTHYYCTYNQPNNYSDHIDPYHYLTKWGITKDQFKKDVENGLSGNYEPSKVDVLDEKTELKNREYPYYKGSMTIDYYIETEPNEKSDDKELLKAGTDVWVYEKKNGWSRINSASAEQWVEDKYIGNVTEILD